MPASSSGPRLAAEGADCGRQRLVRWQSSPHPAGLSDGAPDRARQHLGPSIAGDGRRRPGGWASTSSARWCWPTHAPSRAASIRTLLAQCVSTSCVLADRAILLKPAAWTNPFHLSRGHGARPAAAFFGPSPDHGAHRPRVARSRRLFGRGLLSRARLCSWSMLLQPLVGLRYGARGRFGTPISRGHAHRERALVGARR